MNIFKRHELKYLITAEQREYIERAICEYMTPDEYGESTICNIYYDTDNYRLIRRSIEKPMYKEKLRLRSYGKSADDKTVFLELKKKYDGVVYKRRISLPCKDAVDFMEGKTDLKEDTQIGREIKYFIKYYETLKPRVYLCYDRTAYFSVTDRDLRITFDRNILWRREELDLRYDHYGTDILKEGQSLMEIKSGTAMPLWLVDIINKSGVKRSSFSKYGNAYISILKDELTERRGLCNGRVI